MANSINDVSPDIRDFLLNRNLILSDTVTENGLSARASGLGTQANTATFPTSVQASLNLNDSGEYRDALISRNRYTSVEDVVSATLINNSYSYGQIDGGYIDENQNLYIGTTDGLDTIDSILSQEGFGLESGGISNQGDIRTTLAGRVLGATGAIDETPLGIIGGQQLLLALKQRAFFNAQRELFGQVNLQPFSLLSGSEFLVPDNSITVSGSFIGRVGDIALDVTGFNLPIDIIDEKASIANPNSLERNNTLIRYTGKGQLLRLFDGINKNKYKPAYDSDGTGRSKLGVTDPLVYKVGSQSATTLTQIQLSPINGFPSTFNQTTFEGQTDIWDPSVFISTPSDLLWRTKQLFNDGKTYKTMFDPQGTTQLDKSQITTPSRGRISKGSGVLSHAGKTINGVAVEGDKENIFSRTWSSTKTYGTVDDLQKNRGLYPYDDKIRNDIEDSVLGKNGFVKISPYKVPKGVNNDYEAKKFMFSIENLAWSDKITSLPLFEQGNGDPKTGTKGRIMWFPPYDIKFTDTTAVDWDSTKFIGRGEPVYTYNNTERSGTLSFKIIIDYPDYMNNSKITDNELMASLVAGSLEYNKYFSTDEERILSEEYNSNVEIVKQIPSITPNTPDRVIFYFENNSTVVNATYEAAGLNSTWVTAGYASTLSSQLRQNNGIKIRINGYASLTGTTAANLVLSDGRIAAVKAWLTANLDADINVASRFIKGTSYGETASSSTGTVDSDGVKRERSAKVDFIYEPKDDKQIQSFSDIAKETPINFNEIASKIKRRFHREDEYFEELKKSADAGVASDKIIYDNIREKIKFFHPAFHSTTPEGFNSRLTFLQQCTRQGPTDAENKSNNLAFGSPPVCILRIGDFYNTKIIINTLTIGYDPLVWDLNPEGVGVQPMIANIEIGFKFIGGSAINGPINKLQNAVSFNYFANSGVYDPRADRWVRNEKYDPKEGNLFRPNTDDEKDLKRFIEDDQFITKKPDSNTGPTNDQEATAEDANEEIVVVSASTISDEQIFDNLGWTVTFNSYINSGTTNTFDLTYNGGIGYELTNLSKSYGYKIELKTQPYAWLRTIMTGTFTNAANSEVINSSVSAPNLTWTEGVYGIGNQTFKLTLTSGGLTFTRNITVNVVTGLYV